jgi:[ribosomal protein S5]-alanine N-acetyltransferase
MSIEAVFQSFPQLETRELFLRKITITDANSILGILADDEVTRFYDDGSFTDISQAISQIEAWENGFKNKRCVRWGIAFKDNPAIIGTCGYYGFHSWHMRASIGYELARSCWRKGIMLEALTSIIDYGFREIGLNRIEAVTMPENSASIKLLERLGFCNEGVLHEYEKWDQKGFVNLCMLAILRKEWDK